MKADMSRPTARKYLGAGQVPAELQAKRSWRTRLDPLAQIWPKAEAMLVEAPELEAKVLFEHLWSHAPWEVGQKHLRTFQRRVKQWRLQHGPDKEVFFAQDWVPGQALQLDWTNANELGITIAGQPYDHLLCHWCCRIRTGNGPRGANRSRCCRAGRACRKACTGWARCRGNCGWITAARPRTGSGAGADREFNPRFRFLVRALRDDPTDHRHRLSQRERGRRIEQRTFEAPAATNTCCCGAAGTLNRKRTTTRFLGRGVEARPIGGRQENAGGGVGGDETAAADATERV